MRLHSSRFIPRPAAAVIAPLVLAALIAGCGSSSGARPGTIAAIGAENEYANVIGQIGGKYVTVRAIENNPSTDPHSFEASPSVAQEVGAARLVVQNGAGYDAYMNKIESASPSSARTVIDVQKLLGVPDSTPNPHLWYQPTTMPRVVKALVAELSKIHPQHAGYFRVNAARFDNSLQPWYQELARFKAKYSGAPVATTEPVGDYMLQAAGANNLTPFTFQADVMNGVDPAPQLVARENNLFSAHRVKAFLYNRQVTSSLTVAILQQAKKYGVPVVALYETMPTSGTFAARRTPKSAKRPGFDYQTWMLAEAKALERAVADKVSTETL